MDENKKKKTKVDSNKQYPKPTGTNDYFFTNLKRNLKEKVESYWKAILVSPPLAFRGCFHIFLWHVFSSLCHVQAIPGGLQFFTYLYMSAFYQEKYYIFWHALLALSAIAIATFIAVFVLIAIQAYKETEMQDFQDVEKGCEEPPKDDRKRNEETKSKKKTKKIKT